MKTGFAILVLAIATAAGSYVAYFRSATAPTESMLVQPGGELEWLRREFQLSDAQFAEVKKLHEDYAPKCAAMCAQISEANQRLEQLISSNKSIIPQIEAALKQCADVQEQCHHAMLGHLYAVGAKMPPEQGSRYIEMMKARCVQGPITHNRLVSDSPQ